MSVRADWHLAELDLPEDEGDPVQQISRLKSVATPIDLGTDEATLNTELAELVEKEAWYAEVKETSCDLKWAPGHAIMGGCASSCFGCPSYTANPERLLSRVCLIGRRQEEISQALRAGTAASALDAELIAAFERDIDADAELAELVLAAA